MTNGTKLTASNICYLVTMLRMEDLEEGIRCMDLAEAIGVTRPSAHGMTDYLQQLGLIEKGARGTAFLTVQGKETATLYDRCLQRVSGILENQLSQHQDWSAPVIALLAEIPKEHLAAWHHTGIGRGAV